MLRRSRVGSSMDTSRLSNAVSRPGIDPRLNISLAYALDDSSVDKAHGHFVEVQLLPSEVEVTCRVPPQYAGDTFGEHKGLIYKDDELVIGIPDGDPAAGCFVLARPMSAVAKPSALAVSNPKDHITSLKKDLNYWVEVLGKGSFNIRSPQVRIGDENATEQLMLGTTYRDKESSLHSTLEAQLATLAGFITVAGASLTAGGPLTLLPPAGVAIAAAGAALTSAVTSITQMQTAIQQFEGFASKYLSPVANTK